MLIEHRGHQPTIHPSAYVAPNATICGAVTIGANTSILFGAVLAAEGGPVHVGAHCVIMEQAVMRGTPKHPARLGEAVLVGPHAHLSGCTGEDEVFLATGAVGFNGARLGRGVEVRINGVVHVNTVLAPGALVPIGWVAVGDPAQVLPPGEHEQIWAVQRTLDFPGTVWGVARSVPKGERTRRYARALLCHRGDRELPGN